MNKILKWSIIAVLLVGIIAGASALYNNLSRDYKSDNLVGNTVTSGDTSDKTIYPAPDFTVLDYNGNEVKLSDYKGTPVVINFWATWCYYCKVEMPDFNEAYKRYPDVKFLMVNATDGVQETVTSAKDYIETEKYEFDVFFDTKMEAVNNYYVSGFPSTYFVDKDGNLVAYKSGLLDMATLEKGIMMIR